MKSSKLYIDSVKDKTEHVPELEVDAIRSVLGVWQDMQLCTPTTSAEQ